jgi:thiamine-phosphate pyrophosphorylase
MTLFRERISQYLKLYLVMGLDGFGDRTALQIAEEALAGGVTMIQLREKNAPLRQVLEQGAQLKAICHKYGVPFMINDRVDVALLLDADGVHVGQDDIPGLEVRRLLGADKIIGISAGTMDEAVWAVSQRPDYMGVGPVYATSTKQDAGDAIGSSLIAEISGRWTIPVVGIGGIGANNAQDVLHAGAKGVAVVSAVVRHEQPKLSARSLVNTVREVLS